MPWSITQLVGHPCDVYLPSTPNPHHLTLIYLHDVDLNRLVENDAFSREFDRFGLTVVAPFTGRSWWTDRLCLEFDRELTAERYVVDHVVAYINERFGAQPPRIGLLGTGMGDRRLRMAFKFPSRFPVVAAISPAIDYQLLWHERDETLPQMYSDPEQIRQDTATLHVHPLNWPRNTWFCCDPEDDCWHDSAERLHMKLAALGIPHEYDHETSIAQRPGVPSAPPHHHAYRDRMAPAAVAFLATRLEKERLRLA